MTCSCEKIERSPLWTTIPEFKQPTDIQPGENISCYMKRAGSVSGLKNDVGQKTPDRIDNTILASDLQSNVNTQFKLTPGSSRSATTWAIKVDGTSGLGPLSELSFNSTTGSLVGTVNSSNANKSYQVTIIASDANGEIDSRTFTFFPKTISTEEQLIRFVFPLAGNARVTCGFGPRTPPAFGASTQHAGLDIAMADHSLGTIVAAADGVVVKAGPASGFGNWIVIDHRDSTGKLVATTVYGHMNDGNIYVKVGDKVSAGQPIALEGNAGIGNGAHLHFELHKGGYKNPVDPTPYLSGLVTTANNNDPSQIGPDGTPLPVDGYTTVFNSNTGMTSEEGQDNDECPSKLLNSTTEPPQNPPVPPTPPAINKAPHQSSCRPEGSGPSSSEVISTIRAVCASQGLDASETDFIVTIATIESNLDPYAKNPTSSATGLYQFIDSLAVKYFGIIGIPPTCQNRCNPEYATQAMVEFYKREMLPYWNAFLSSGRTRIANKPISPTSWSGSSAPYYAGLDRSDFLYGLVHHDGVGNAVSGQDKGGVAYWRKRTA